MRYMNLIVWMVLLLFHSESRVCASEWDEFQGNNTTDKSALVRSLDSIDSLNQVSEIIPLTYSMLSYEIEQIMPKDSYDIEYIESESGMYKKSKNFGFIASSKNKKHPSIIVAFRGTKNLNDYITDVRFSKIDMGKRLGNDSLNGYFCHKGFLDVYSTPREKILHHLKDKLKIYDTKRTQVIFTGHSLGAALSQIAALDVLHEIYNGSNSNNNVQVVSFASPRVFDQSTAEYFDLTIGGPNHLRFVNKFDVVPKFPKGIRILDFDLCTPFKHTGIEIAVPPYRFVINTPYFSLVNYFSELKKWNIDYYADMAQKIGPVILFYFASEYIANNFGSSAYSQALKYIPGSFGVLGTIGQGLHNSSTYSEYVIASFKEFKLRMSIDEALFEDRIKELEKVRDEKIRYVTDKEALAYKTARDDDSHTSRLAILVHEMENKKPGFLDSTKRIGKGALLSLTGLVCVYKSGFEYLIAKKLGLLDENSPDTYKQPSSYFTFVNDYNWAVDCGLVSVGFATGIGGVYEMTGGTKDMLGWGYRKLMGKTDRS